MKLVAAVALLAGCTDDGFTVVAHVQSVPATIDKVVVGGDEVALAFDSSTQVSTYERHFPSIDGIAAFTDYQLPIEFWTGATLAKSVVLRLDACEASCVSNASCPSRAELSRETFSVTVFVGPPIDGVECAGNGKDVTLAATAVPRARQYDVMTDPRPGPHR